MTGVLDESALTGESRPSRAAEGDRVRSGAVNAGRLSTCGRPPRRGEHLRRHRPARDRGPGVEGARGPAGRPVRHDLHPGHAGHRRAAWALCGDPVRGLSVLMVATPCPLILAVPIAIVAGISRAAQRGIIVKNGGALETIARGEVLLFDKTGTLTSGMPASRATSRCSATWPPTNCCGWPPRSTRSRRTCWPRAIVRAARERDLNLDFPDDVTETHRGRHRGQGRGAPCGARQVAFVTGGGPLPDRGRDVRRRSMMDGSSCVFVAVDGAGRGRPVDRRPDPPRLFARHPFAPTGWDQARRHGDRRSPRRRRIGRRGAGSRSHPQ